MLYLGILPLSQVFSRKYAGTSSYFPKNWDDARILDEVEYAIQNNHGKYPKGAPNEYFGYSRDRKVEIHFYLSPDGNINSFFPSIAPL